MNFAVFAVPIPTGKSGFILCLLGLMTSMSTDDKFPLFADSSNMTGRFINQWKHFCHRLSEWCTVAFCTMPY